MRKRRLQQNKNKNTCLVKHQRIKNSLCSAKENKKNILWDFLERFPVGILLCLYDDSITIVKCNDCFLSITGYTKNELDNLFHNQYVSMVYPEDQTILANRNFGALSDKRIEERSYRLCCKGDSTKWILDKAQLVMEGKKQYTYHILIDITPLKKAKEELRLTQERYQFLMNQSSDIIFEWDIKTDSFLCSSNYEKKFGYVPKREDFSKGLFHNSHIHPADIAEFSRLLEEIRIKQPYQNTEIRIEAANNRYLWCHVQMVGQPDKNGTITKVIGLLTDIDEQKRMIDALRSRAERDALTGLYNREQTELLIKKHLDSCKQEEICALLMIDTDNFKSVNDTMGHLFGDAVLSEIANGMKKKTSSYDIVGRVGGDEFAVFLTGLSDKEAVIQKAEELLVMFRNLFQEEKQIYSVTCSIGIALYPFHGQNFRNLYLCADHALYQAKSMGKNQFSVYEPSKVSIGDLMKSSLGANIDSNTKTLGTINDFENYVFQILYESENLEQAIRVILEILGKLFDVSRVYIFENSLDGQKSNNTFQWCNTGIKSHNQTLQGELFKRYYQLFDENGIFYCRDINDLPEETAEFFRSQNIFSLLQYVVQEKGEFRGFIGFDECSGPRLWTKNEISTLSLISKIVATFLLKKRAQDKDRMMNIKMRTLLNCLDSYVYVVEKDTYRLLYLNQKARDLDKDITEGMYCYQALYQNTKPCNFCPIRENKVQQHYNKKHQLWTQSKAVPIQWDSSDAFLVSCYDITCFIKTKETE